jgi:hypothetical protein
MTRFLSVALLLGVTSAFGLAGCSEKSGVEETTKVKGPEGTETIKKETTVESSGNPPATTPAPAPTPTEAPK